MKQTSPIFITAAYYACNIGLGLVAASLGPSLPSLTEQTHVQLKEASLLFSGVGFGYLLGALWSGRILDRRPGHPILVISLLMMSFVMVVIPLPSSLILLIVIMVISGGSQAFLDVGGNTLLVWLHREKVSPFMNGLHLFWGIGSMLSPILIAQAILRTGNYAWAFWIIALLLIPLAWLLKGIPSPVAPYKETGAGSQTPTDWPLVILFMLFFVTFVAVESAFGGWIYSYAIATKVAQPAIAAVMTSVYWGALTLSRVISIPLALRFRPRTLLIINLIGTLISLCIAVLGKDSPVMVWLATILLGASIASMFPVSLSFAGETITITGQFTSLMFVGASLGGMSLPWLIGQFFESSGPHSAMVIMLADMLVCCGIFVVLNWVRAKRQLLV